MKDKNFIPFLKMSKLMLSDKNVRASSLTVFVRTNNIYCFFRVSKIFCQKVLHDYVTSTIKHSFVSLSKANKFKLIDFNLLKFIVSRSDLNITSEIEVFRAIVEWVEYDKNTRINFIVDLLKQVRLPLLSSEIIKNVIKTHSLCSDQNSIDYIDSVLVQKSKGSFLDSFQNDNRCCMHESVAFMFHKSSNDKLFPYKNPKRKIKLCTITKNGFKFEPSEVSLQALQFYNTKYYLQEYDYSSDKYPFSEISSQWKELFPSVIGLEDWASCLFMDRLFILGGFLQTQNFPTSVCWAFDQSGKEIDGVSEMLTTRRDHSCVVFDGKIVVTGGSVGTEGSVEAYDHHLNKWTYMPDLMEEKYCHGSVAMGNKFYVIGGTRTQSSEVFDKISSKFARIKQSPRAVTSFEAEVFRIQNKIVVKLERIVHEKKENVFIYDTITDKWTSMCVNMFKGPGSNAIIYKF